MKRKDFRMLNKYDFILLLIIYFIGISSLFYLLIKMNGNEIISFILFMGTVFFHIFRKFNCTKRYGMPENWKDDGKYDV